MSPTITVARLPSAAMTAARIALADLFMKEPMCFSLVVDRLDRRRWPFAERSAHATGKYAGAPTSTASTRATARGGGTTPPSRPFADLPHAVVRRMQPAASPLECPLASDVWSAGTCYEVAGFRPAGSKRHPSARRP